MFSAKRIQTDFSRAAAQYDAHAQLQHTVRGYAANIAKNYWKNQSHILDIGCGTGALAADAQAMRWQLQGVDLSLGMCSQAKKLLVAANADACALPFADASFDGVFSSLMLQWVNDPQAAFREMLRVLNPGGHAVVATLTQGTLQELERAFSLVDSMPHVSDFKNAAQIIKAAEDAGFVVIASEQDTKLEYFSDTRVLMQSLKAIGATDKPSASRKGLMTAKKLASVDAQYRSQCGQPQGLPATWQLLYLILRK